MGHWRTTLCTIAILVTASPAGAGPIPTGGPHAHVEELACDKSSCVDSAAELARRTRELNRLLSSGKDASWNVTGDLWFDGRPFGFNPETGECEDIDFTPGEPVWQTITRARPWAYRRAEGVVSENPIVYINGVNTDRQKHCQTLRTIGEATCRPVIGLLNATERGAGDVLQTAIDRSRIAALWKDALLWWYEDTEPDPFALDSEPNLAVKALATVIVQNARANSKRRQLGLKPRALSVFVHSQGGALTSNAMRHARNILASQGLDLRDVQLTSLGSAAALWPDGPGLGEGALGFYEHYLHVRDATPLFLGLRSYTSWDSMKAGEGARVIRFFGEPNSSFREVEAGYQWKENLQYIVRNREFTKYHHVDRVYVEYWKQRNGVCGVKR